MTARQIRAARVLLGWTQETLAEKALVALTALKRLESESGLRVHDTTADKVTRSLKAHGIVFLSNEGGIGVILLNDQRGAATDTSRSLPPNP